MRKKLLMILLLVLTAFVFLGLAKRAIYAQGIGECCVVSDCAATAGRSVSCQGAPSNCGPAVGYGECYYTSTGGGCTSWSSWGVCNLQGGSCYQTRWCQAPSSATWRYQIRGCTCPSDCTPSCSPRCGQNNGCGRTCSNADNGAPDQPTPLNPGNGDTVGVSGGQVTVSWSSVNKAEGYEYNIWPVGSSLECSDPLAYCNTKAGTQFSFTPSVSDYYYRVRAINTSCGTDYGNWAGAAFTVEGVVSGQVKDDPNSLATLVGDVCVLGGASGVEPGSGSEVVVSGSYTGSVDGSGNYSITAPVGVGLSAVLVPGSATWNCTCPAGCSYGTDVPKTNLDYFVTDVQFPWFQVEGGNLHADVGNVSSNIPASCAGACDPYLITADGSGTTGMVSYTGSLCLGSPCGSQDISEDGNNWNADTSYQGMETGYAYFSRILEDDPVSSSAWDGSKPTTSGVYSAVGGVTTTGGDWSISSGTIVVLLADGEVTIDNNINVDSGGFLAIISSGNISISGSVTNVEGVFIADGTISTGVSVDQLTGEGIFTGWGGFSLGRDLDTGNDSLPGELFIYRPDLQANAYNYLMRSKYSWQEVAP